MITTPKEYYSYLHRLQTENPPRLAVLLPVEEKIYNIDLNTRTIETPEFLSVEADHQSETIYFEVNRYFDNFDLSKTTCIIQYINANGDERVYKVPFFDVETKAPETKMLFPWCIEGEATKKAGNIKYAIKFYQLDGTGENFLYNLNTIASTSKILHGMNVLDENEDYNYPAESIERIIAYIDEVNEKLDTQGYNGVD